MGYVFGVCVEKNSELEPSTRKYKGRVVVQGNRVVNQSYEAAIFQDLGSALATLDASRAVDAYGCVPGHAIEVADAEQAYVQADMRGTPTWVCLPPEVRTGKARNMRRPVCRLKKALDGHPDAGAYWEEHCGAHVQSVGFEPTGCEWPSTYFHPGLQLYLVIYVDDF